MDSDILAPTLSTEREAAGHCQSAAASRPLSPSPASLPFTVQLEILVTPHSKSSIQSGSLNPCRTQTWYLIRYFLVQGLGCFASTHTNRHTYRTGIPEVRVPPGYGQAFRVGGVVLDVWYAPEYYVNKVPLMVVMKVWVSEY